MGTIYVDEEFRNMSQPESIDMSSEAMGSVNMELAVIMGVLLIGIPVLLMSVCFFGYIATKCVREEGNQQPANLWTVDGRLHSRTKNKD